MMTQKNTNYIENEERREKIEKLEKTLRRTLKKLNELKADVYLYCEECNEAVDLAFNYNSIIVE